MLASMCVGCLWWVLEEVLLGERLKQSPPPTHLFSIAIDGLRFAYYTAAQISLPYLIDPQRMVQKTQAVETGLRTVGLVAAGCRRWRDLL